MTPEQADLLLLTLKAAYPHADNGIDPVKAKLRDGIYRNALAAWGYASAQEAVKRVIASCRFYPTVAELHDAYSEANRPRPELAAASNALPAPGHTTASPEEIRSACAAAIATVEANVHVAPVRVPHERGDLERIEKELASRKGIATPPENRQEHEEWCAYPHPDSLMCPSKGVGGGPVGAKMRSTGEA